MASYYSTTLKLIELFRTTYFLTNVCKGSLHGYVLGFVAMRLKTPERCGSVLLFLLCTPAEGETSSVFNQDDFVKSQA